MKRREFAAVLTGAGAAAALRAAAAESVPAGGSLTDVPGLRVGHFTDPRRPTGCTAILFDEPAAAGVDYDGSAPGEQLVVMLQPASPVEQIHAILLSGGGVFGLGAVAGAQRFHVDRKIGFDWGSPSLRIPLVVGAIIDDLAVGDARIRPDPDAAYKACEAASTAAVAEGNVGAGAGGTVGRMLMRYGMKGMKGGIGSASLRAGEVVIGALAVVNPAGDVVDWRTGRIVAGALTPDGQLADTMATLKKTLASTGARGDFALNDPPLRSTTLVVVATNVGYSKTQLTKIAMMANSGGTLAIRPYHTTGDGDQLFAVSTAAITRPNIPLTVLGSLAAEVIAEAIVRGVRAATSVEGWPAVGR
jgi:L-aminopeptidase/D-esterase-like protein